MSSIAGAALRHYLDRETYAKLGFTLPLLPGDVPESPMIVTLSPEQRLTHTYLIGGTGSGKTNTLLNLIANDLRNGLTVVVVDLRGDLVDRILRRLFASHESMWLMHHLVLVDLRDEHSVTPFNPLVGDGDAYSRALFVHAVLRREADSWGVQMDETVRNSLIALAETGWSLLEIEPLLTNPAFRQSVLERVSDPYVKSFFARYGALSEEKQQSWRLPVLNKITPFLMVPRLRRMFGARTTLPLSSLLNVERGTVLLVSLAVDRLHEAAHLAGGLIVSALQNAMMARVDTPEAARPPVMMYVDEFQNFVPASDRFAQVVSEGRRFGLGLTLSHQNLSQLPASLSEVIRNNIATQILFQTGALDASDLAREIVCGRTRDEVRDALLRLRVGEAFLVRRGREARRIQTYLHVDSPMGRWTIAAARAAGVSRFAIPAAQADADLAARLAQWDEPVTDARTTEQRSEKPRAKEHPAWEVRYGRSKRFDL
jgi:DNA helicase HerA-like ATPase